ncbi:hypothetical protein YN1_8100 [Nanoarchaeota archaeon]
MDKEVIEPSDSYILASLDISEGLIRKINKILGIKSKLNDIIGRIKIFNPCNNHEIIQLYNSKNNNIIYIEELECKNFEYYYYRTDNLDDPNIKYYRPLHYIIVIKYMSLISPMISNLFKKNKVYFEDSIGDYILSKDLWSKVLTFTLLNILSNYYKDYNSEVNYLLDKIKEKYKYLETIKNHINNFNENIISDSIYYFLETKTELLSLVISKKYYEKYGKNSINYIKNNIWANEDKEYIGLDKIIEDSILKNIKEDNTIKEMNNYRLDNRLVKLIGDIQKYIR